MRQSVTEQGRVSVTQRVQRRGTQPLCLRLVNSAAGRVGLLKANYGTVCVCVCVCRVRV